MQSSVVLVSAAEMIVVGCAGILTYLSYRAYRRTGSPSLRTLMVGLALVGWGGLLGGALYQFSSFGFTVSMGVESVFTALGFVLVIYALYAGEPHDGLTP